MKYVAFLRGIGPENPNMRGAKLREFFESLDFSNVKSFISSGNVLFESPETNASKLEDKIEKELPKKLSFSSITIIRNEEDLKKLIDKDPFEGALHGRKTYLNVTFLKNNIDKKLDFSFKEKGYEIVKVYDREICFIINQEFGNTPKVMNLIEKTFDKKVTTRTWKTVSRIYSLLSV